MQPYTRELKLMGNNFALTVVAKDAETAHTQIDSAVAEIRRIENLLSTFKSDSQATLINNNAGLQPVTVDAEVLGLIERCSAISKITQGAFDITYGGVDKTLWNFDKAMTALPSPAEALKSVHLINYQNIIIDKHNSTVFLKEKGMRIGFGGIGKGYGAERAKEVLQKNNVQSALINASGDLTAWGLQPSGKPWTVGISDPDRPDKIFSYLNITGKAVATSGNYEKFVMIGGKKYSHTIDPKTGLPVHGIKSVTILCDNAEFADAMATPINVMGIQAGLYLINQLAGVHCIIIDDNNKLYTSKHINLT